MDEPARKVVSSYAEYLEQERASPTKHEFLNGEIFAMAGGTPEHARLCMSVGAELRAQLRGRPCAVYSADLRVRVQATGLSTYPDVSVVCGKLERDLEDKDAALNPSVLVEVLSDSSEAYDRGQKFAHYRHIPSLREYVLVSQHEPRIEVFHRNEDDSWTLREARAGQGAHLEAIGCTLSVDEVYRDPLAQAATEAEERLPGS
ncbi:Uma2 family endonuclease [Sorangium sp. So ce1182]|uniref:Uma2 family endonuclease n=1 Tax=Sorangium sp. So ce1182 TaxID=3133334 RepID=UPI003F601B1A